MNITAIVGVGIIGAILAIAVKNVKPELGIGVSIITGIAILSLVLPEVAGILQEIKLLSESSGVDFSYFEPVIKIIGICYITQFSAEIIKDAGECAISKKVELAGKIAILIMLLPILRRLILVIISSFGMV